MLGKTGRWIIVEAAGRIFYLRVPHRRIRVVRQQLWDEVEKSRGPGYDATDESAATHIDEEAVERHRSEAEARNPLRRIHPQYGLSVMLAGMVVVAIWASWLGERQRVVRAFRAQMEEKAAAYDRLQYCGFNLDIDKRRQWPPVVWLQWIGDEPVEVVSMRRFNYFSFAKDSNPKDLALLSHFPELEQLRISECEIDRRIIETINQLPNLTKLDLHWTNLDDDLFADFEAHPTLLHINLTGTRITDATFERLASFPKIITVDARGTRVTPDAARRFHEHRPEVMVMVHRLTVGPQ